ncbi:hypothetical protein FDX06_11790 [Citrobacter sp. wls618]|jgi:hypothetical protein|nr:hypothetical protein IB70_17420 [Citrobacter braakii]OCF82299.1 hypothetical protein AS299_01945 [Citrobacter freundii]TKT95882.1 hypothetical protein FDW91_16265 [Citrobacter sp. wls831]TKU22568.1 hypothetical protein FDW87_06955 [Citrobacter sp. wls826]TKU33732.1 hypothetical protein FDW99_02290 [Citrobacter sp. wls758]TKV04374.1 hypothetical protein FDX06_11790 [Citrobacter sp. wls618]TKV31952.1 hypothetical protein FDX20_18695 [Citrobacter sp. TBCS-11]
MRKKASPDSISYGEMTLKRFKKSCSFFFSTQVKLTNYLLNLEITHIFSAEEKKLLTQKRRQPVRFSSVSKLLSLTEMLF